MTTTNLETVLSLTNNYHNVKNLNINDILFVNDLKIHSYHLLMPDYDEVLNYALQFKNQEKLPWQLKNAMKSIVDCQDSYWRKKWAQKELSNGDDEFKRYALLHEKTNKFMVLREVLDDKNETVYKMNNPQHTLIRMHEDIYPDVRKRKTTVKEAYETMLSRMLQERETREGITTSHASAASAWFVSWLIQEKYFPDITRNREDKDVYYMTRALGGNSRHSIEHVSLLRKVPRFMVERFLLSMCVNVLSWVISDVNESVSEEFVGDFLLKGLNFELVDSEYYEDFYEDTDFKIKNHENGKVLPVSIKSGRTMQERSLNTHRNRKPKNEIVKLYVGATLFGTNGTDKRTIEHSGVHFSGFKIFGVNNQGKVCEMTKVKKIRQYVETILL